jgi:hypothetical protein
MKKILVTEPPGQWVQNWSVVWLFAIWMDFADRTQVSLDNVDVLEKQLEVYLTQI